MAIFDLVFQRYKESLLRVRNSVGRTVELAQEGVLQEEEALPILDECAKEVREIEDCVNILHYIWRNRQDED